MSHFLICSVPKDYWSIKKVVNSPPNEDDLLRQLLGEAQALWRRIHNRVNLESERSRYLMCAGQIEAMLVRRILEADQSVAGWSPVHLRIGGDYLDFIVHVLHDSLSVRAATGASHAADASSAVKTLAESARCAGMTRAGLGSSILSPEALESQLAEVQQHLDSWKDMPKALRREVEARQEFIRLAVQDGCGVVEIQEVLDNSPSWTTTLPSKKAAPTPEAQHTLCEQTISQPLGHGRRQQLANRLRDEIRAALADHGKVNMSSQPHELSTEILSEFVRQVPGADHDVSVRIAYADGSEARSFPLRVLPPVAPVPPADSLVIKAALLSMRHLELDKVVDFAWYRNKEVSQSRALSEADEFCFDYSLRELRSMRDSFKGRHVTLLMYHTGFEPASIGFYRALTVALMGPTALGVYGAADSAWIRVVPLYFRGDDGFEQSHNPWG